MISYVLFYVLILGLSVYACGFVTQLLMAFMELSLSTGTCIFGALYVIFAAVSFYFAVCRYKKNKEHLKDGGSRKLAGPMPYILALVLLALIIVVPLRYEPVFGSDCIIEKTQTLISDEALYLSNPLTGTELLYGTARSEKFCFLPTTYAVICGVLGFSENAVSLSEGGNVLFSQHSVYAFMVNILPAFVLTVHLLLVYFICNGVSMLFPGKNRMRKYGVLMFLVYESFVLTENIEGTFAFNMYQSAFSEKTFISCILIPFVVGIFLNILLHFLKREDAGIFAYSGKEIAVTIGIMIAAMLAGNIVPFRTVSGTSERKSFGGIAADEDVTKVLERTLHIEEKGGSPYVCAPKDFLPLLRMYDAGIKTIYGKNMWDEEALTGYHDTYPEEIILLCQYMESGIPYYEKTDEAFKLGCNLVATYDEEALIIDEL